VFFFLSAEKSESGITVLLDSQDGCLNHDLFDGMIDYDKNPFYSLNHFYQSSRLLLSKSKSREELHVFFVSSFSTSTYFLTDFPD
jgi:hypothetical protein